MKNEIEVAKEKGFLVYAGSNEEVVLDWVEECDKQNTPYVEVVLGEDYATVNVDMLTVDRTLSASQLSQIRQILEESVPSDKEASWSEEFCSAEVESRVAPLLAEKLLAVASAN